MKTAKWILLLALLALFSIVAAFYFHDYFRRMIQHFFLFFHADKIYFFGKGFLLFASTLFVASFSIFNVLFFVLLLVQNKGKRFFYFVVSVLCFFLSSLVTSFFDSSFRLHTSPLNEEGQAMISKGAINYDLHFLIALCFALLPLAIINARRK